MDQRNTNVDLFRLIASFSVCVNHSLYAAQIPWLTLAGRWTVPFFFMISGYFFYQRYTQQAASAFIPTLKAILSIVAVANLVYVLFVSLTTGSLRSLATHFTILVGAYFHLWFLTSLLIGYLTLWFFISNKLDKGLPYLAAIILGVSLTLYPYHLLLGNPAHPIYARSLLSIPFLCIGFLVAKFRVESFLPKWVAYLLISIGLDIQFLEACFLTQNGQDWTRLNFLGGTLLFSVGMFLVALQLERPVSSRLSGIGRRYSLSLYLYQPIISYLLYQHVPPGWIGLLLYWLSPVWTMVVLLLLFRLLYALSPALFHIISGTIKPLQPRKRRPYVPDYA
jgi:surface polysaccharide O-acyltransferase-like enzyme